MSGEHAKREIMTGEMRRPLCPLTDEHLERLKGVLASKGLLA